MIALYWRSIVRPLLAQIALVAAAAIVISALEVISIGLIVPLIDLAINAEDPNRNSTIDFLWRVLSSLSGSEEPREIIVAILISIVALVIVKGTIELAVRRRVGFLSTHISNSFLYRMFQAYLLAPYTEITKRGRRALIQNMEIISDEIRRSVHTTSMILYALAYIVAILAVLLYLSWWATLIVGVMISAGVVIMRRVLEERAHRLGGEMLELGQRRSKLLPRLQIEQVGLAQLHNFVATLPDGYDTVVGDRGLKLSGGQGQRIAIARAIACRPPWLIFDEATSALDNRTEQDVQRAIEQLRGGAIILVIAHRLSTVRNADQIILLNNCIITELGSHEELMALGGDYYTLYSNRENSVTQSREND